MTVRGSIRDLDRWELDLLEREGGNVTIFSSNARRIGGEFVFFAEPAENPLTCEFGPVV